MNVFGCLFGYLFIYLFIYFFGCGRRSCMIRSRPRWMIQRPRLTDKSWHLMCVAVGQSPPGPFPGVNSQLECQKQYTSLSSLFFLCRLRRGTIQESEKEPKEKAFGHSLAVGEQKFKLKSQNYVCRRKCCLLCSCNSTVGSAYWVWPYGIPPISYDIPSRNFEFWSDMFILYCTTVLYDWFIYVGKDCLGYLFSAHKPIACNELLHS